MVCDYYIQSKLVIDYLSKDGKICTIYTNMEIKKGYVLTWDSSDSDDDLETSIQKYKRELERKIKEETYDKILYENGKWIKDSYCNNYEAKLLTTYSEISKLIKVYKKNIAYHRNEM